MIDIQNAYSIFIALDVDCEPLKMRLFSIAATTFVATLSAANPVALTEFDFSKRACMYNHCQCAPGAAGVYCGWCDAVTVLGDGGSLNHVYQCDPENSSNCCDYGTRQSCAAGTGPCGG